jgi:hypothetical protein
VQLGSGIAPDPLHRVGGLSIQSQWVRGEILKFLVSDVMVTDHDTSPMVKFMKLRFCDVTDLVTMQTLGYEASPDCCSSTEMAQIFHQFLNVFSTLPLGKFIFSVLQLFNVPGHTLLGCNTRKMNPPLFASQPRSKPLIKNSTDMTIAHNWQQNKVD